MSMLISTIYSPSIDYYYIFSLLSRVRDNWSFLLPDVFFKVDAFDWSKAIYCNIWMPVYDYYVVFTSAEDDYGGEKVLKQLGGSWDKYRMGIAIRKHIDSMEVVELRLIHELLHCMGLPADDMEKRHPVISRFLMMLFGRSVAERWYYKQLLKGKIK